LTRSGIKRQKKDHLHRFLAQDAGETYTAGVALEMQGSR
jgi:hypothetical protein